MGKWRFQNEKGETFDHAWVNGYHFGDRLLEGVMFKVVIEKGNKIKAIDVDEDSRGYTSGLNMKRWIKAATDFASTNDIFYSSSQGNDEIFIVDSETRETCPNIPRRRSATPITMCSMHDIVTALTKAGRK
jgi:hypothetical protein